VSKSAKVVLGWRSNVPVFGISVVDADGIRSTLIFTDDPQYRGQLPHFAWLSTDTVLAFPAAVLRPKTTEETVGYGLPHVRGAVVLIGGKAYIFGIHEHDHRWIEIDSGVVSPPDLSLPTVSLGSWQVGFETLQGFDPIFSFPRSLKSVR
jgi:hypothetical protein